MKVKNLEIEKFINDKNILKNKINDDKLEKDEILRNKNLEIKESQKELQDVKNSNSQEIQK